MGEPRRIFVAICDKISRKFFRNNLAVTNSCRYSPEVAARKRLAVKAGGYLASVGGRR
jgi:hypothetical protein